MTLDELVRYLESAKYPCLTHNHYDDTDMHEFFVGTKNQSIMTVFYDNEGYIRVVSQRRRTMRDEVVVQTLKDEPNYRSTASASEVLVAE